MLKYCHLRSQVGVDYTRLHTLLAAGQWREADEETKVVMLKAAGREQEGLLDRESSENFPSEDLHTIDQLWVKYSQGRFGFSVQKWVWESIVENSTTELEASSHRRFDENFGKQVKKFSERVGWYVEENWLHFRDLTFDTSAPEGHLPSPSFATPCDNGPEDKEAVLGRWCAAFCFGGVRCGVLFLGWWSLLSRQDV